MAVQRTRFRPPAPARRKRTAELTVRPLGGIHKGLPPQDLPPGMSPECQNFVSRIDGYITPRSGLSQPGTWDFGGPCLGAIEMFDSSGRACLLSVSTGQVNFRHADTGSWTSFTKTTYLTAGFLPFQIPLLGTPSGGSTDYFQGVSVYDSNTNENIAVFTNNVDPPLYFRITESETSYSGFSYLYSIASTLRAKAVESINDRLVFFNCTGALPNASATTNTTGVPYVNFPTRVMWSARGNPKSFLIADGAGAEDLMDMQGDGQAMIRFREYLLLFTEHELWRATPTLDNYAFRFDRVRDAIGCPFPRTIVTTQDGVIYLGRDREVYMTDGSQVVPLGPLNGTGSSRIQRLLQEEAVNLDRAWATINESENRYELYYTHRADSNDGYPARALYYAMDDRMWWPQAFPFGLAAGTDFTDPAGAVAWDDLAATVTWESATAVAAWDSFEDAAQIDRRVNVFTSKGTQLSFRSNQTTDDGTAIDARWRSGGVRVGNLRKTHLTEVWTDYEADSASSFSLYIGSSRNTQDFDSGTALSMTTPGGVVHTPTWKTDTAPLFEIRLNDGGTPRIVSFLATLKEASRF